MMKRSWYYLTLAAFGLAVTAPAQAQSDEAVAAATALFMTPAGSFVGVSPAALGDAHNGAGLDYGRYTGEGDRNNFGAHLDWHAFRATLGLGSASGADNLWMAGVSAGRGLLSSTPVRVGLEGDLGYGRIKDDVTDITLNAFTAGARVPLWLSSSSEGMTLVPYLAPGGYFGRLSSSGASESGFRATLNGGVRVVFANGVALDVGAQRVFIDDAETLFGLGLSFSRR